jgi:hypothetical protein
LKVLDIDDTDSSFIDYIIIRLDDMKKLLEILSNPAFKS